MGSEEKGIKKYSKSLFDKVIVQVIWTIGAAIGAGITTFAISRKFEFTKLEIGLFVTLVVFIVTVFSYIIYRRKNRKLPQFPEIDPNFYMLREERVHKWIDKDNYIHKRRYSLKALKNGLTQYIDKFQWTGTEYTISGGTPEYTIEKETNSKNVFEGYGFKFKKALNEGDKINVEVCWHAKGPAKPFFSTTIEEPTDLLILSVMLYPGCGIIEVNCETESYKGARVPIKSEKQKLNSDGEYVWQVKDPKLLYHYEINW